MRHSVTIMLICAAGAVAPSIPDSCGGRLQPGVKVALSAMTALFVFQEQGYRVNLW